MSTLDAKRGDPVWVRSECPKCLGEGDILDPSGATFRLVKCPGPREGVECVNGRIRHQRPLK